MEKSCQNFLDKEKKLIVNLIDDNSEDKTKKITQNVSQKEKLNLKITKTVQKKQNLKISLLQKMKLIYIVLEKL